MKKAVLLRAADCEVVETDWGRLIWCANARLGNSTDMTVGQCEIKPGRGNPPHSHPNCTEILVVREGSIMHAVGDGSEVAMGPGDTISVPPDVSHYARNIGDSVAVLLIAFSSADRQTKGE